MYHLSRRGIVLAGAVAVGLTVSPALSAVFNGVETNTSSGQTGSTSGGSFLSATVTGTNGGGDGVGFDTRTYDIGEGVAFAEADTDGNLAGDAPSPLLRASSTADTSSSGSQSYAGAIVPYQYTGAAPGLVTYTYTLTADLNEPDPVNTAAFVRARGGFVINPEFFETSINQYFESSSFPVDDFSFTSNVDGLVNQTGSVSFIANPGEVFHLVLSLTTQAGHTPAFSDASSTLSGLLTTPGGTLALFNGAGPLTGDLDGDGFVGINDLNIVLGNWNQNVPPADPQADPSGDGFVGIDDLNAVLGNWNAGTPPPASAAVPEPASVALLGACGALALCRRRTA
jgi:PEP-CTERM motif